MKIYVFGNQDSEGDSIAIKAAEFLDGKIKGINFQKIKPNDDLPVTEKNPVIIDAVSGIEEITIIDENSLEKLISPPKSTVHDYDLGFQLKYLMKLGKLKKVTIIGLPMRSKIDYTSLQSILRKLVAQDIQGS